MVRCRCCQLTHRRYQTIAPNWDREQLCEQCYANVYELFSFSAASRSYHIYWYEHKGWKHTVFKKENQGLCEKIQ